MRKTVVEMYTTADNQIKFVKAKYGGWIVLVDADSVGVDVVNAFHTTQTKLSDMPGLNLQIASGYDELAEFIKEEK